MSWINRVISSFRKQTLEENLDDELQFHLEMRRRAGESAEQVSRRFGSLARIKDACRDVDTVGWIGATGQDLRYACRAIRKSPGFTVTVVSCLALGIGANTAIFSFVNAFLLRPLPVERPNEVVMVGREAPISYQEYLDWKKLNRAFSGLFAFSPGARVTIEIGRESEYALGEIVTDDYFRTLGVRPTIGRAFGSGDDGQPLAVISEQLWKRRFHGDSGIIGRIINLNHRPFTIVGIAPRGFPGMLAPWSTEVWATVALHPEFLSDRKMGLMSVAGRLNSGMSIRQAELAMIGLDVELQRLHPDPQGRMPGKVRVRHGTLISSSPIWGVFVAMAGVLTAVVGIIFLIACANVAGLLLARDLARRREIAIRLSLGASRGRLIRQLLTESCLLAAMSTLAGTILAFSTGDMLASFLPASISGGFRIEHGIDVRVLGFTLLLAVLSVMLSGLVPALRASGQNLTRAGKAGAVAAGRTPRLRQVLTVAQVTLSVLALGTAGLFVRSLQKGLQTDLGFQTSRLLTVAVELPEPQFTAARRVDFHRGLTERIAGFPGVESISSSNIFPNGNTRVANVIANGSMPIEVATATVSPRYFTTMGIRLEKGREFRSQDRNSVIVNEAMAKRFWAEDNPVGKTVRLRSDGPPQEVIGVARNGKYWSLDEAPRPFVYRMMDQPPGGSSFVLIRTAVAPETLAEPIRREIQSLNDGLPPMTVTTGNERLRAWLEPDRAAAMLIGIFGVMALGLTVMGLYGLLAHVVTQRTPEIAIRMALGAQRANVVGLVLRESAVLVSIGVVLGIAMAGAASRLLASLILRISPTDGVTFATVALLLVTMGLVATLIPAYRAVRIDPIGALRSE